MRQSISQSTQSIAKSKQQLKDLGVVLVYVFGSVAEQMDQPHSDLDLAVLTTGKLDVNTLNLYADLYDIFTQIFPGKKLDIVFMQRAPLELRFDIITHGQVFFESDPELRLNFEELTMRQYADYKPILRSMDQAILNRI